MFFKFLLTFGLIAIIVANVSNGENIDSNEIDRYCYPEDHKNTRKSCECITENAPPWGMRTLRIDCSFKDLLTKDLSAVLPLYLDTLDLSWNQLDKVPVFVSDSLRVLNVMHNNISTVVTKNFVKVFNVRELYLNWNSIQTIELNAFTDLAHLQILDLSHNNIISLSFRIFSPMLILETLNLSWNRQLNKTEGIHDLDFYETFGVNSKLHTLKLEACSLSNLILPANAPLNELVIRRNLLKKIPDKLPTLLEKFDFSENLIEVLLPSDTSPLAYVKEFYVEDMPRLQAVGESSLATLQSLNKISFQNSRRLTSFDAHAFGVNATKYPPLKTMIFRGTTLRSFNSTLSPAFRNLTELDLNGMPLYCDCELIWVKQLNLETNGRCFKPSRLRGMRLSNARVSDFSCNAWPRWVYGIMTLGLLIICSAGIYLIVMGLRPHRGVTMRRKVGANSPYARVTIEPNRQEN